MKPRRCRCESSRRPRAPSVPGEASRPRVSVSPAVKKTITPTASNTSASTVSKVAVTIAKLRRLVRWGSASSASSFQIEAARAIDEADERLRRQRLELGRQHAGVRAERMAASTWRATRSSASP